MKRKLIILTGLCVLQSVIGLAQPTISSVSPAQNALDVVKSTNIEFTFDEAMDEATLTSSNIKVFGSISGFHSGTFQYNSSSKTLTFDPDTDFLVDETVTATLKTAVESSDGNPLASPYLLSFRIKTTTSAISLTGRVSYTAGSQPTQSILADFDNDGDLDVATANGGGNNVSVFLNTGPGKFAGKTDYGSGGSVEDVEGADVNGDGFADILIVDRDHNTLSVFINKQDGTFASRLIYGTGESPSCLTTTDLDGDGDLDVLTGNNNSDNVSVLLNNGDGTFAGKVDYAAGDYPNGITTGDFDNDGDMDFATSNNFSNSISVLLNNGDGTFASKTDYTTGTGDTYFIQAGDLDNDGDMDLMAGKGNFTSFAFFKNNGDGTFDSKMDIGVGTSTNEVNFSDVDGDGDLDIVAGAGYSILLAYNDGDATFSGTRLISATYYASNVASGDIDRDGKIDFVASNYFDGKISVFKTVQPLSITSVSPSRNNFGVSKETNITVKFSQDMDESTLSNTNVKVTGLQSGFHTSALSFNHSAKELTINPDTDFNVGEQVTVTILTKTRSLISDSLSSYYSYQFSIENGEADGTFNPKADYSAGLKPRGLSLADFDKDGDLDIAVVNGQVDPVLFTFTFSILVNNGNGTYAAPVKYSGGYQSGGSVVADFNNDGYVDFAFSDRGSNSVTVAFNNGDGTFASSIDYSVATAPNYIAAADMDGDGDIDIITPSELGYVSIIKNNGLGVFGDPANITTTNGNFGIKVADFDDDGDMDIATTTDINNMGILINNGNLTFSSPAYYTAGSGAFKLESADFNNDNNLDLAVANYSDNSVSVFINNGNGTFASKVDYAVGLRPQGITSGDFNNDGSVDIITANAYIQDSLSVLFNNGNGTFAPRVGYLDSDEPYAMVSGDVNGDGMLDLVVSNNVAGNISVFIANQSSNPASGTFANITYDSETSLTGNVSVSGTLTVGAQITTGNSTIDLGSSGSISGETPANYIVGKVQTTRTVSTVQNNIAGLGISIDPHSNNMGSTVIKRETGTAENSSSIKQVWTITPETQPSGPVTVTLTWPSTNDNSINLNDLVVYKSEDSGETWNVISATINKDSDPRTATFSISSFSQFTIGQSGALPVEMVSFAGHQMNGKVMLNWSTATESNNVGWEIEYRQQTTDNGQQKNTEFRKVGFVAGKGTTTEKQSYSFAVSSLQSSVSIAEFRLKQLDSDGKISYSNVLTVNLAPVTFGLSQNYPNPFNPVTVINYHLAADSDVRLVVYDVLGREVASLVNEKKAAGFYSASFNATNISTGVYFYKLTAGNFSEIKKMTLIK